MLLKKLIVKTLFGVFVFSNKIHNLIRGRFPLNVELYMFYLSEIAFEHFVYYKGKWRV